MHQVIFHLSLKKQSYTIGKVKSDYKGRNWLTLSYIARERRNSWESLRKDFFPTESLPKSILSGHLAINFLSDLGFLPSCWGGECPRGVMVKAMDCGIVVRKFVLQSHYYVHIRANTFGKGMNPLILPAMG